MDKLLDVVSDLVYQLSPEKIKAIASRLRQIKPEKSLAALSDILNTPIALRVVNQLFDTWKATTISPDELSSMLLAASHTYSKVSTERSAELVCTGPTTPFVSARRTEQALLQVINSAQSVLFITSFVAYDVSSIVKALNIASNRGVVISMLLESSEAYGGTVSIDAIGKMKLLVPSARLYSWRDKEQQFIDGRVHAKIAVADGKICFITSANLTGFAMNKNIEVGVLISGGDISKKLEDHLNALIDTRVISIT